MNAFENGNTVIGKEKLRTQTAINTSAYLAARMVETSDITKARLQSFIDAGQLILDASQEGGEPIDASTLCSFFREHVEEQDTAFENALKDLDNQNWVSRAITKGGHTVTIRSTPTRSPSTDHSRYATLKCRNAMNEKKR